ncbi:MAG: NAD+ synthase [Sandaracinaceae bacterium]|nr:NAD+ synthase [Sandaracinaceae bacterium]
MRVALCQVDPTVGDFVGNRAMTVRAAVAAAAEGAQLAVFPELSLCGYPPRDWLEHQEFIASSEKSVELLCKELPKAITVAVGFVSRAEQVLGRRLHNSLAVIRDGRVVHVVHKRLLPTYDVFDEDRYFEPGIASTVVDVDGVSVGFTICEDIWNDVEVKGGLRYRGNPIADLVAQGASVIVNAAASPFTLQKREARTKMLREVARHHSRPIVFVNQVGGNDDLIFDGHSAVFGPDGEVWARAHEFHEDQIVCDIKAGGPIREHATSAEGAALDALVLGTRDYAKKCGFRKAVLGLSGGIDSALTACIAVRAFGKENVLGVALPTRFSSEGSLVDAKALAVNLGIEFREVPIDQLFQSYIDGLTPHLDAIAPTFEKDVTFENIQSRIRCAVLMGISNRAGHLLLTTGNKSEIAVGYCTLYGDMAGGLAVISDLPKTFVYKVSAEVNRQAGMDLIPKSTMEKAPSAELRPDQTDQDSLPPYDVLDAILERYIEEHRSVDDIVKLGLDRATVERVVRLVTLSEYKRRQMAPGLIVTRKAFGPGRRYPLAAKLTRP